MAVTIRLQAPNDNNGNARRVFVVMDNVTHDDKVTTTDIIDVFGQDEGADNSTYRKKYGEYFTGPTFNVPASEYRNIIRDWERKNK